METSRLTGASVLLILLRRRRLRGCAFTLSPLSPPESIPENSQKVIQSPFFPTPIVPLVTPGTSLTPLVPYIEIVSPQQMSQQLSRSTCVQNIEEGEDLERLTPRERFLRAKVDHYLERAEECVQMARYTVAKKFVEKVLSLDPGNTACRDLGQVIDTQLLKIAHRGNGSSNGEEPGGTAHARRRKSELVLVVDQDEQLLASLCGALHHYGFEVISAASYDEAIDTLSLIAPDVVISEVNFEAGPRGFDLYHWLKTHLSGKDIPFLFLAARIDRETLIAGKRFGVDDFILKPVDDEVITASVVNCLARRKSAVVQA